MEGLGESLNSPFCLLDLFVTINASLRVLQVEYLLQTTDS